MRVELVGLHEDNVIKIKNAQQPCTKKEVRSFLGLTGYDREYIPHYAEIASPLSDLTKRGKPNKNWKETHDYAFNLLKSSLLCEPILKLPQVTKLFMLRTDASNVASNVALGAVLLWEYDGQLFPVSFASRKLSSAERNYSTIERDCLAVVWAIKKFTIYVYGVEFTLQTDYQPLANINRSIFLNDHIMRWAMILQNYVIKFQCIKGFDNVGADFMSRICDC